jgi:hypothetical protein
VALFDELEEEEPSEMRSGVIRPLLMRVASRS